MAWHVRMSDTLYREADSTSDEIYLMAPTARASSRSPTTTGTTRRLTATSAEETAPAWSPDGSTIAYQAATGRSAGRELQGRPVVGSRARIREIDISTIVA